MPNIDGYSDEFLEWYFSAQCDREAKSGIKERGRMRKYVKEYYHTHPEYRARQNERSRMRRAEVKQ